MQTNVILSGAKIKSARLDAGLTQAALAHAINTRERNIIRWENDQHAPRLKHIAAIAEATGKDISFFVTEHELGDDEQEDDRLTRIRRIRAELVLHGRDDLADDLLRLSAAWVRLKSEDGSIVPTLVVWAAVLVLLATGWTL